MTVHECPACEAEAVGEHPRKLKKALRKWVTGSVPTMRERNRILRAFNRHRREQGHPQLRRLPDGRVSLLELP